MSQFKESSLSTLLTALFQDGKCHFGDVISYHMYVIAFPNEERCFDNSDKLLSFSSLFCCGRQWVVSNQKNEKSLYQGWELKAETWNLYSKTTPKDQRHVMKHLRTTFESVLKPCHGWMSVEPVGRLRGANQACILGGKCKVNLGNVLPTRVFGNKFHTSSWMVTEKKQMMEKGCGEEGLMKYKGKWKCLSCVRVFVTPRTKQSMEFSRPEYWVAFPFSRGSSPPRDWTQVSCIAGSFFTSWTTREAQEYSSG